MARANSPSGSSYHHNNDDDQNDTSAPSFILTAARQAQSDLVVGQAVYLLDPSYLQNWLIWALQYTTDNHSKKDPRVRESLRVAALKHGLVPPNYEMTDYTEPGPIDSTALAVEGHPLVLNPWVRVKQNPSRGVSNGGDTPLSSVSEATPYRRQRQRSFMSDSGLDLDRQQIVDPTALEVKSLVAGSSSDDDDSQPKSHHALPPSKKRNNNSMYMDCVAVPESFYETLRAVHGVVCEDYQSISFQRFVGEPFLLHHQQRHRKAAPSNGNSPTTTSTIITTTATTTPPRPVEFRRKIILEVPTNSTKEPTSLMDKLLAQELSRQQRDRIPTVEVHPLKLTYTTVHDDLDDCTDDATTISSRASHFSASPSQPQSGNVLVSRDAGAVDALCSLLRVAAPRKASQSVRLWSRHVYHNKSNTTTNGNTTDAPSLRATRDGDEYELIDMELMTTNNNGHHHHHHHHLSMMEWVERHGSRRGTAVTELQVLVETRRTVHSPWPRAALELEQRLQVGDFVDAQDVAGKWYEAVVRSVKEDYVTVHYAGWASRWDARIRRRRGGGGDSSNNKIQAPAPLWSQTGRWREQAHVGMIVEVRDSSSIVQRPKWYRGVIKKVGKPTDKIHELYGGADLEEYPVEGDPSKKEKLLILKRTQQALVEVEQEKSEKAGVPTSPGEGDLAAGLNPQPPFLRWVNLYGEEICKINTHLKDEGAEPVTLRYEYERDRKPVEILKPRNTLLGSGFMRESLRGMPPAPGSVGLQNLGNSCFLNSTIQCLNHIEPLTQYFLQDKFTLEINRRNPLGSGGNVATAYASLLKKMWSGEYSILAPRLLKQTVANFAPQFDNSYQHDSQEFCQFLLDGIHEDLNRVKTKPYVEELEGFGMDDEWTAIESWRKHLLRHDSIVVDHCQGMHRSHLTCPHCGRESIKFDVYSSISLPLVTFKDESVIHLEDCIEKFMEGEQLDERNAWYCPSCRKHVCALKMIALWSVPDILVLHLKRFTFDTDLTSGGMLRSKIGLEVQFPIEGLDLTEYVLGPLDDDAPPVYKLFGVSEHTGPTANSGHYTATVRNSIDDQWYRCNDSHVGLTSGEASITGGAYVLFYQRTRGMSKWGGMAKVMKEKKIDPYGGLETDQEGFRKVKSKKKKGSSGK